MRVPDGKSKSIQNPNVFITHASEKALEQNVFHVRVKWLASQQKIEIAKLQELVAGQKKELEELRLLNNSHWCVVLTYIQKRYVNN